METPQYINISSNIIAGFNHNVATRIRLSVQSTGAGVIALNHSTTTLGYEFLPNPANNGLIRYRYAPNSTTTVLGFDGPNMFINISYLTAQELSIINPANDIAGVIGGPPCQGFSTARLSDAGDDINLINHARNSLYLDFYNTVKIIIYLY